MNENTYVENPNRPGEGVNAKGQRWEPPGLSDAEVEAIEGDDGDEATSEKVSEPKAVSPPATEGTGVAVDPKGTEIDLTEGAEDKGPQDEASE